MSFPPPGPVGANPDERELLLAFLAKQRSSVVAATAGLSEQQARWTPGERLIPLIGIINHLTHVEWRWIEGRYLGRAVSRSEEEFRVGASPTLAEVVSAYHDRAMFTDATVREAPGLSVPCTGGAPAPSAGGVPIDLRWVLLHLIEETARHAGHADSTREMLDGTKAS